MPAPLATVQDVADIWRPLTTAEQSQATNLIVKASAMLRHACPFDIDQRMALEPTDPLYLAAPVVASVVAEVVKRVMKNPNGYASESEATGPYSQSHTFTARQDDTSEDRGGLYVDESDIAGLYPTTGYALPFTIQTRPQPRQGCWPEARCL